MKINKITATHYAGVQNIEAVLRKPITLFSGQNYAGKSSLRESIVHALTGQATRVTLKKAAGALVSDGAKSGHAIVDTSLGRCAITLPNGKHESEFPAPDALPYVLDAQQFARLDQSARRAFLFGLMAIKTGGDDIAKRLADKQCDPAQIELIRPYLVGGFDAAHTEAQARCREAKGGWKATTGEAYGSQKAIAWKAPTVTWDDKKLAHAQAALSETDAALARAREDVGTLRAQRDAAESRAAKIAGLRQQASQYARHATKLEKDKIDLDEWEKRVADTERLASGAPAVKPLECPCCGKPLVLGATDHLEIYVEPELMRDPEAVAKLDTYRQARDLMRRSVDNDQKLVDDADGAARALKALEDGPVPLVDDEAMRAATDRIENLQRTRCEIETEVRALSEAKTAAASADERTARAYELHRQIAAWDTMIEALSPNGVQADLLKGATAPINARLLESAGFAEWLPITISDDMGITSNGRDYGLLSESEKYRADCMIAEAISHFSGLRLIVLDRVDVLDQLGRVDLIEWLSAWAADGDIESALLFCTLKEPPAAKFDHADVFWIEDGKIATALNGERQAA